MLKLEGYDLIKELNSTSQLSSGIYRRLSDDGVVVLKFPREQNPASHVVTKLRHEYHLLKQFDTNNIIKAVELIETYTVPVLVLEKIDKISLQAYLQNKPLDLETFFKLALQIVSILQLVHEKGIAHKDIKPANLLIDPTTLAITLIDFGIASQASLDHALNSQSTLLEGSLAYLSPEQTGRMNIPVDFRTDFYSLGITFYQMLTGMLPYREKDSLDLMYSHIARNIPAVIDAVAVPEMLSRLVAKLMAKAPEDRYNSDVYLLKDLEH